MLQKLFNLTFLLATALSQKTVEDYGGTAGTPMELAKAVDGNVTNAGFIGEDFFEGEDGKALTMYFSWTTYTTGDVTKIPTYSWIQSYAQMEDPTAPGKYLQATCNVGYNPNAAAATGTGVVVNAFYGDSITVEAIPEGKWDSYGTPLPEEYPKEMQYQRVAEEFAEPLGSYATNAVEDTLSSQTCTVWAPMYAIDATGQQDTSAMNDEYFKAFKDYRSFNVATGFRIWKRSGKSEYIYKADGGSVSYMLQDWSNKITYPSGSGATGASGMSGDQSGSGKDGDGTSSGMDGDDMMMEEEDGGMMMIIIIVVAVAVVLILIVSIIFCVMRSKNNKKTEIQLKEGGEVESVEIEIE